MKYLAWIIIFCLPVLLQGQYSINKNYSDSTVILLVEKFNKLLAQNNASANKTYTLLDGTLDLTTIELERPDLDKNEINNNYQNIISENDQVLSQYNATNQYNAIIYLYIHEGNIVKNSQQYDMADLDKETDFRNKIGELNNARKSNTFDIQQSINNQDEKALALLRAAKQAHPDKQVLLITISNLLLSQSDGEKDKIETQYSITAALLGLDESGNLSNVYGALNHEALEGITTFKYENIKAITNSFLGDFDGEMREDILVDKAEDPTYKMVTKDQINNCHNFIVEDKIRFFNSKEYDRIHSFRLYPESSKLKSVSVWYEEKLQEATFSNIHYVEENKVYKTTKIICFDCVNRDSIKDVKEIKTLIINGREYEEYIGLNKKFTYAILANEIECTEGVVVTLLRNNQIGPFPITQEECNQIQQTKYDDGNGQEKKFVVIENLAGIDLDTSDLYQLFRGLKKNTFEDGITRRDLKLVLIITNNESQFADAEKITVPDEYKLVWVHYEDGRYKIKKINSNEFTALLDLSEMVNKSSDGLINEILNSDDPVDVIFTKLYLFLDLVSKKIASAKIDPKYWNCNDKENYNPYYKKIIQIAFAPAFIILDLTIENANLQELPIINLYGPEARFASLCGIWDGILDILISIPDGLKIVPKLISDSGRKKFADEFNRLRNYHKIDTVTKTVIHSGMCWAIFDGLLQQFDPSQNCVFAHNVTALAVPIIISFFVPTASESIVGQILKPLFKIIQFSDKFDIVSNAIGNTLSLAIKNGTRLGRIAGKNAIIIVRNSQGKFKKIENEIQEICNKIDDNDVKFDGEPIISIDHPLSSFINQVNDLIDLFPKSKAAFNPSLYKNLDEIYQAYLTKHPDINWNDFLKKIDDASPELKSYFATSPASQKYFNYKKFGASALGLTEESLSSLRSKFPGKDFEIEAAFINIANESAEKLADDLKLSGNFGDFILGNIERVKAWDILHDAGYATLRKNPVSLQKLNNLISNPNLTASNLTEDLVRRAIKGNRGAGAGAAALDDLTDGLNSLVNSGTNFTNYSRLIGDLEKGSGFAEGAGWVQKYLVGNTSEFAGKNLEFEIGVISGRVDLKVGNILYEFKSVGSLPPTSFTNQVARDLQNVTSFDQMKWYFDGDKLPNRITQADKDAMLSALDNMNLDEATIRKFVTQPPFTVEAVVNQIEIRFSQIFQVK